MSDKNKLIKSIGGFCFTSMIIWFLFICIFPFLIGLYYRTPFTSLIKEISQNLPYVLLAPLDIVFWILSIILKVLIGAIMGLCFMVVLGIVVIGITFLLSLFLKLFV